MTKINDIKKANNDCLSTKFKWLERKNHVLNHLQTKKKII